MEEREIINRVQSSSLVTLNLEDFYEDGDRLFWDLKVTLFQEQILRERDFREFMKDLDLSFFKGKHVAIGCTVDAIIPSWAYMIVISRLQSVVRTVIVGDLKDLESYLFAKKLATLRIQDYKDAKVVVKGCGKIPVPIFAYGEVTRILTNVASSIMYGEPCSTVPVFKKSKLSGV